MSSNYIQENPIAAIATPHGIGGLAVVRLSGAETLDIVTKCITYSGNLLPHHATYTYFQDPRSGETLDEVVATYFQAPKSYTGEDVVEISCHGGYFVAESILGTLLEHGARMSEPGEFTKRAFLNGRIDLTQAEAVADLIHAQTSTSHRLAIRQLQGQLKEKASAIRQQLIDAVSLLELELDFSEDEISHTPYEEIEQTLKDISTACEQLVDSYQNGQLYRNGILTAIVGRPNAGKSSILNALLQEERALVSDIPGTTRDTLEESISHDGVEIRLVDTAGLRDSEDVVESLGISRAQQIIERADVILHVRDVANLQEAESTLQINGTPVITLYNKIDLLTGEERARYRDLSTNNAISTSATEMIGISDIGHRVLQEVFKNKQSQESSDTPTITNQRHRDALRNTLESIDRAIQSTKQRYSSEFIVVDLRAAMDSLGLLSGDTTTDDILNNIFSKFCIGK
ncbi:MAG TPA: tRNA uridine-5-carboxymethylaminomethyl(34) synthesis GTPase MnmE [bacterium]|nr:tRNA uridine-5-carboxymethylaminomethyl(34) synthesis GTPase MnmE [bacterium]